jgi:hypothetical protein
MGAAFSAFPFAGINWINYRGSDDNATIKIADDKVKFFPVGRAGRLRGGLSPATRASTSSTPRARKYVIPVFDRDRNMWWRQEVYSYPLFICKRPEVLQSGRAGA